MHGGSTTRLPYAQESNPELQINEEWSLGCSLSNEFIPNQEIMLFAN
jgi:hypothetical protein